LVILQTSFLASWPWDWSPTTLDKIGVLVGVLTLVALGAAAVVAALQVGEAQRSRRERSRPFVVIDFGFVSGVIIEIVITNIGKTIARDVRFAFDPPLVGTSDDDARGPISELPVFRDGIPSLAPGREVTIFFDSFPARVEARLPLTYTVFVTYVGHEEEEWEDTIVLDLAAYLGTGGVTVHGLHDIHKQLERIAKSAERWSDHDGLKILTRSDRREREAEWSEILRKREEEEKLGANGGEGEAGANATRTPD
jgi:hypothetical protein